MVMYLCNPPCGTAHMAGPQMAKTTRAQSSKARTMGKS
eukprot:CAMPEP_0194512320 /NCGR_PEP_ID=MMETSP0253-20130528/44275_1 /TAXON_ID=2966 /ORGANISM="Noctiluca scintillans" /LENGTH=37 /DNA_ID= /DNA_START= /DNA_END= /DNA_ORIENTATION=